ncbi:MAG: sigma-70 family RNA polymerase sigma factor [Eubacterium sp.]|nr:sigma-70 family RNA polymerase sigma factor [Eubacterium sp.]
MINVALNPSDAVENALNLFGDAVLRLAYSYLKTREDAEDVVQDTLIRLMQSEEIFENEEHMKAWMLRVAANLCKDILKSSRRQKEVAMVEGYEAGVEDEYNTGESDVMKAVMSLPEKYRSVIHLYYFEEYATKEIAEITGKKEATVRSLLKRGREKLESVLSKKYDERR